MKNMKSHPVSVNQKNKLTPNLFLNLVIKKEYVI